MNTEFRKVRLPKEIRGLMAFDRKVFPEADRFPAGYWRQCQCYWLLVGGSKVGCCAFNHHVDFQEDLSENGENPPRNGSLYISSTGILPDWQGLGFGRLMKAWQIAYARTLGFERVVTNTRAGNAAMIALNRKFGFRVIRRTPGYYCDPTEAAVVMELRLNRA